MVAITPTVWRIVCLACVAGTLLAASPNFANRESAANHQESPLPQHAPDAAASANIWRRGFSEFFGTPLDRPDYETLAGAIAARLNRATLDGIAPKQALRDFENLAQSLRKQFPSERVEIDHVGRLVANFVEYLERESAYRTTPRESELRALEAVVATQAALIPEMPQDRVDYIINTIRTERLFPPSSILFGCYLLPCRPMNTPSGSRVLEVAIAPKYQDEAQRVQADVDLVLSPGPVVRLDFDTARTARLAVERSGDGLQFRPVQEIASGTADGVVAPLVLDTPIESRYIRLVAESNSPSAVLRNVRAFALKPPAAAICSMGAAPAVDGRLDDPVWHTEFGIGGFVCVDAARFAAAQTAAAAACTRDALYLAVRNADPRLDAMAATATRRDSPLWDEEALELRVRVPRGAEYRFIVNPLGTRFDSRDAASTWDGLWQAAPREEADAWTVELAVPWIELDLDAPADLQINLIRYRHNVRDEISTWCLGDDARGDSNAFAALVIH